MFNRFQTGQALRNVKRYWLHIPAALGAAVLLPLLVMASDPPGGVIAPTVGSTVSFNGTALESGSLDESTCVEGVNCDTYVLSVGGTLNQWKNRLVKIELGWGVSANDYDLYVHKDSNAGVEVGRSGGGSPQTAEAAIIDPYKFGLGVYTVHVVYFAGNPAADQPHGKATVITRARKAMHLLGGLTFSPSVTVRAPAAGRDGEPSLRCDPRGNCYVAGIRGVPAGVDLWYFDLDPTSPTYDPYMRNPIYRGQPDSFTQDEANSVGADGGGDVDIAVGFDDAAPGSPPILAFSSLVAANVATGRSLDKGATFELNPAGNVTGGVPVDDRQWLEFYGKDTVFLLYRTLDPAITQIQRSTDGGLTYGPAQTAGGIGQVGTIDVDQNDGTVYISGSDGKVAVGIPPAPGEEPTSYTVYTPASDANGVAHIFFTVKVAADGTAYACWSNGQNVYLTSSTDKGQTWAPAVQVNYGGATRTAIMPWMETGPTPGSVGIVWYGTNSSTNSSDAKWKVFYAQSNNAKDDVPVFQQVAVTQHYIHAAVISNNGLQVTGGDNRNLIDYFQIAFDPQGRAVIAYTDDHNDFDGNCYVTHMISGPSVNGPKLDGVTEGPNLPPPTVPAHMVTDFANDVSIGLLTMVNVPDPLDIDWIDYSVENSPSGKMLVGKMHVTDLSVVPPLGIWRMNFAANVTTSAALSPTKDYSYGLSDTGDQFYIRASTDALGTQAFTWGTTVRNSDGSLTSTAVGNADAGSIDSATGTITVKVLLSQLNAHARAPIGVGSVICGLRGSAFTSGTSGGKYDDTRGGTRFVIK